MRWLNLVDMIIKERKAETSMFKFCRGYAMVM